MYRRIKIKTEYKGDIKELYTIEEMDFYTILIPRQIKDGTKHRIYNRIINALIYINPKINLIETLSFIYHLNEYATPKMNIKELFRYVTLVYTNIIETGEIKIKPRIKKIHFDMKKQLTTHQKQSIAAKANGILKTNKTIDKIQEAIMTLASMNETPTNKRISDISGLSLSTIKRNKFKEKSDPMKFNSDNIVINNVVLEEISEEEFFKEQDPNDDIEISYKNIYNISKEDKKLFLKTIKDLNEIREPDEKTMMELLPFEKEKSWFLYNKWMQSKCQNNLFNIK